MFFFMIFLTDFPERTFGDILRGISLRISKEIPPIVWVTEE